MKTAQQYQSEYENVSSGKNKAAAHNLLVGAERALAKQVAPEYFKLLQGGGLNGATLKTTGEYDQYYAAWGTTELEDDLVLDLAPKAVVK